MPGPICYVPLTKPIVGLSNSPKLAEQRFHLLHIRLEQGSEEGLVETTLMFVPQLLAIYNAYAIIETSHEWTPEKKALETEEKT